MKKIILPLLISIFLFAACGSDENTQMERKGFVKATIINMDLDGCEYVIQLESGQKVEPVNLEEEFKADGLDIWVKYNADNEKLGACMIGPIVNVEEMQIR
ncbi:MAG: hypothetical protein ACR2GN_11150 [Bacteroidia bacterium]